MDKIQTYSWWGSGNNEPPALLKTKRQIQEMGLRPVKAVGVIHCREYDCLLYDPELPESAVPKRKASPKQLEVLAKNREKQKRKYAYEHWYKEVGFIERDRVRAVKWAKEILGRDNWTILDTETTGLGDAEIIEIAIIDHQARTLLNTLIKPTIPIPVEATAIHGISDEMVKDALSFPEVFSQIHSILEGKQVLIYNVSFDICVLSYCRKLHGLEPPLGLNVRSECIMEWYSQWCGDWSQYWKNYRWQPLGGGHRALEDCKAALERIQEMAEDSPEILYPQGIYPPPNYELEN
ncbi:3'-5' exonuclease [Aliterella atlantica]|uniref:3'-5' exonuclease n=1 Tax=Aliterella atlantica TaxID=1827278 RepID=UPI000696ACFA|nr:3'-5' exonuclease [Aliterella atlantica]